MLACAFAASIMTACAGTPTILTEGPIANIIKGPPRDNADSDANKSAPVFDDAAKASAISSSGLNGKDHESFAFLTRMGLNDFQAILGNFGARRMPPRDCYRIWKGKEPIYDFSFNGRQFYMTEGLCNDWADDLVLVFDAYGYQSDPEIFKSEWIGWYVHDNGLPAHSGDHRLIKDYVSENIQLKKRSNGTRMFCDKMSKRRPKRVPTLSVMNSMTSIDTLFRHNLGNKLAGVKCVRTPARYERKDLGPISGVFDK